MKEMMSSGSRSNFFPATESKGDNTGWLVDGSKSIYKDISRAHPLHSVLKRNHTMVEQSPRLPSTAGGEDNTITKTYDSHSLLD